MKCYATAFEEIDRQWNAARLSAAAQYSKPPSKLAEADAEELRQVLYGPGSPTALPPNDLDALLPKDATDAIAKRREEVARWSSSANAPPQMLVLNDADMNKKPHIFLRGNPGNPGKTVPRQFPVWWPVTIGSRFTRGAAGSKWLA